MEDLNKQAKTRPSFPTARIARSPTGTTAMPTHDEIAQRAYEIYLGNGCQQGHSQHNWQQAEQELCSMPVAGSEDSIG